MGQFQINVTTPFWFATPGGAFYRYSEGQHLVGDSVAFGIHSNANFTHEPLGAPITNPGTITVSVGSPGAQRYPQ
jgi:hypothetical protein